MTLAKKRCSAQWQTKNQGSTNVSKPDKNSKCLIYLHTRNLPPSHHTTAIKPRETSSIKIAHLTEHSSSLLHLIQILHIWFFSKDQLLWFHVWDKFCMQEASAMVDIASLNSTSLLFPKNHARNGEARNVTPKDFILTTRD